jgi:hypothetical protein
LQGNEWYGSNQMLDRAASAMLFWSRLPHRCGAVDEWYRHEHSYCATAFTTYGISEALLLLETRLEPTQREGVLRALTRAGDWLSTRFNDRVMNQNLAACAALWNLHTCTGAAHYKTAFASVWRRTLANQDEEGWFTEYGGADLGYSLLALDLLAALDRRGFSEARAAASRLSRFRRVVCSWVAATWRAGSVAEARRTSFRSARRRSPRALLTQDASPPISARRQRPLRLLDQRRPTIVISRTSISRRSFSRPPSSPPSPSRARPPTTRSGQQRLSSLDSCRQLHRLLGAARRRLRGARWVVCGAPQPRILGRDRGWPVCELSVATRQGTGGPGRRQRHTGRRALCSCGRRAAARASRNGVQNAGAWLFRWCAVAELWHRALKRRMTRRATAPLRFTRELRWERDSLLVRDVIARIEQGPALRTITPVDDIEIHSPSARLDGGSKVESIRVPAKTRSGGRRR